MILACDLGGTRFRAAILDRGGRIRHRADLPSPPAGADGIDPECWWTAFRDAVENLPAAQIEAVAITGITRTQVFLDSDSRPLRPAMLWNNSRADAPIPQLPQDHPERPQVNAFHPIARLAWLRRHQPGIADRLAAVVEPKDFLNLRLTGICAIDRIGSARLIAGAGMLGALGYSPDILPPALAPASVIGHVQPGLPGALAHLAGRPVVAIGPDTWASVLGLGALRPGLAYNLSGTTEVFGAMSRHPAAADGLLSVDYGEGLHQLGGPSLCGGDTLDWLLHLLGRTGDTGASLDAVLAEPRDSARLIFLPYLQGERVPHWDPALRGAFIGLNRQHGPADCAQAALEGIAFLNRLVLERAEAAIGAPVDEIRFGGGGAASAAWCQLKADITGRDIVVTQNADTGLLGAAIAGFTALGEFPSLAAGQAAMVQQHRRFQPRPGDPHRALYDLFRAADAAVAPISRALAAL